MKNPLRYFILLEGGVVALVATALASHGPKPLEGQLRFWNGFAGLCGLFLSSTGPREVEVEKYRVDLLAVWDHWAIIVEAKTKKEHIKEGQLKAYYDRIRLKRGKPGMLTDASSIAVVFLTPSVGEEFKKEFDSLVVQPGDKKLHLKWKDVLSLIESSFPVSAESDESGEFSLLGPLMSLGVKRVRELDIE